MYRPETIKPNLELFISLADSITPLLPDQSSKVAKDTLSLLTVALKQDWFLEILCYLLNTFSQSQVVKEVDFNQALKLFTEQKTIGLLPTKMNLAEEGGSDV